MSQTVYPAFKILLVDDEPAWLNSLSLTLKSCAGLNNITTCQESRDVMALLDAGGYGLVLLDLTMPHLSGEELLRQIGERHPEITAIVVSGLNQLETAVRCMRLGAYDYFIKTDEEDRIVGGVLRAVRKVEMERDYRELSDRLASGELRHPEAFAPIVTAGSPLAYRSRLRVHLGHGGVGLYARDSHTLVPIGECAVCVSGINMALRDVGAALDSPPMGASRKAPCAAGSNRRARGPMLPAQARSGARPAVSDLELRVSPIDSRKLVLFAGSDFDTSWSSSDDASVVISGEATRDLLGFTLALGDLDEDGTSDLLLSAPDYATDQGRVYWMPGR